MNTIIGLIITLLLGASGMLYNHKNKLHKRVAIVIFVVALMLSILLGIKAIIDSKGAVAQKAVAQAQSSTITSNNQSGGFTGINSGVVNLKPLNRELKQSQIDSFKSDLATIPNKEEVTVTAASSDGEISGYSSQLFDMLIAAGFKNVSIQTVMPAQTNWIGVTIFIKDPSHPPSIAAPLFNALTRANIKFDPRYDPNIKDADAILINVGKAP